MFKRLMIGLVAVGLVAIFIAEAANAKAVRRRNTVENIHTCNRYLPDGVNLDPCFGAETVTDILSGWDVLNEKAICTMTGTVVCNRVGGGSCTDPYEAPLDIDSFTSGATFVTETKTASDLTVLPQSVGQPICDVEEPGSIFSRFWPNVAVAHTTYSGDFENIPVIDPTITENPTTYELIELCSATATDQYDCVRLWDSVYGSDEEPGIEGQPMPKFPCCGEENSLNVVIEGAGKVISDPAGIIDCTNNNGTCSAVYNGLEEPYDGCPEPEITLTASPPEEGGWEFITWSGDCTGTDPCTVTPETSEINGYGSVTAEFWPVLTVEIEGIGTVTGPGINCPGDCSETYDPDTTPVTLSASTDLGNVVEWTTNCTPISEDECRVTPPAEVTAVFSLGEGFIRVTVTGDVPGQRVWIQNPNQTNFTFPDIKYCRDVCVIDTTSEPFLGLEEIVIKRKGGAFLEWIGEPCIGGNNSVQTCDIPLPLGPGIDITASFPLSP